MFSTSEVSRSDDMDTPTNRSRLIVVADAACPQAQSAIETLLRHNCESKQKLRNKIAARTLQAQQAAQKEAAEAAEAQPPEGTPCLPTPSDGLPGKIAGLNHKRGSDAGYFARASSIASKPGMSPDLAASTSTDKAIALPTSLSNVAVDTSTVDAGSRPESPCAPFKAKLKAAKKDSSETGNSGESAEVEGDESVAPFPLHTQTSAARFTENLPPSLSSPINSNLVSNVPNDATTSTVLVDSEGIVHPVGMQPITSNIIENIKGSPSQTVARFTDQHTVPKATKSLRSDSNQSRASASSGSGKDAVKEILKGSSSPDKSTSPKTPNESAVDTAADEEKKELLIQQARLRAAVRFEETVEDSFNTEFVQPWLVKAVFNADTPDEVVEAFQRDMRDKIEVSFSDKIDLPVAKVELTDGVAMDGLLQGAYAVFVAVFDDRGIPNGRVVPSTTCVIDSAHRVGVEHLVACLTAESSGPADVPVPQSILDVREVVQHLAFDVDCAVDSDKPAVAKSALFKYCTVLSMAIPFEIYLSQQIFQWTMKKGEGYRLDTHIPAYERFPFSSMRDVGPFVLQALLAPEQRDTHSVSLISDIICLRQATDQATQNIYHSFHKVLCPGRDVSTVERFFAGEEAKWFEERGIVAVYDLIAWWIRTQPANAFLQILEGSSGRNKLCAWRHFIFKHSESVLEGWRNTDSHWNSASVSTNSYRFNRETPTFSHRGASTRSSSAGATSADAVVVSASLSISSAPSQGVRPRISRQPVLMPEEDLDLLDLEALDYNYNFR